jgi:hypothetical protein
VFMAPQAGQETRLNISPPHLVILWVPFEIFMLVLSGSTLRYPGVQGTLAPKITVG